MFRTVAQYRVHTTTHSTHCVSTTILYYGLCYVFFVVNFICKPSCRRRRANMAKPPLRLNCRRKPTSRRPRVVLDIRAAAADFNLGFGL